MSNQQLGTLVGAVAGYFTGGLSYVAIGATVGGAIGSAFTEGEKTEGPRLNDLKVSFSTYGVGIPLLYGTERIGGNCVWSTDKLEIANTQEGGKGSPPEHTTYRYYVHQRYVLCETPRDGSTVSIVRIFVDGKVQWDSRSGIPLASALASSENLFATGTLRQGDPGQLPDPVEESWLGGPGSVTAYRGVVSYSIVALECPGGRIPQISFVLSTSAEVGMTVDYGISASIEPVSGLFQTVSYSRVAVANGPVMIFAEDGVAMGGGDISPRKVVKVLPLGVDYAGSLQQLPTFDLSYVYRRVIGVADIDALCVRQVPASTYMDTGYNVIIDPTGAQKGFFLDDILCFGQSTSRWAKFGDRIAFSGDANQNSFDVALFSYEGGGFIGRANGVAPLDIILTLNYAWLLIEDGFGDRAMELRDLESFALLGTTTLPSGLNTGAVYFAPTDSLDTIGAWIQEGGGASSLWTLTPTNLGTVVATKVAGSLSGLPSLGPTSIGIHGKVVTGVMLVGSPGTYSAQVFVVNYGALILSNVKVSDVLADLCERAGEFRYDVSEIPDSDVLHGYKLSNVASARANIEHLLVAFAIYIVDEDGLIKFKKRKDIVSVATISYDELGQAEDGSESGDPMPLNHTQEVDLLRSATVNYIEPEFDYQVASEVYKREVTDSIEDYVLDLPIALTSSDQAKQVAQWAVYERALAQNTRSCKVSRKYAYVSPGDGLTIEYPRGTQRLWFVSSTTDTGALCEFTLQPGDAQLMTQTGVGATGYPSQDVAALPPPTRLQLLDIPLLRDQDNNAGIYAALDGYGSIWSGAELFVGDSDQSLLSFGTVSDDAPIGSAETALGDWDFNLVDETNLFTVSIGEDVFLNVTRDQLLAGNGEYWALGVPGRWEIGASALGDDLGNGRYTLSRHLRGLFGTEQYAGMHQIGDTFVLLRIVGMLRPNLSIGEIGQSKTYRPVSKGRSFDSAPSQTYVNTGEGLRPLSPVNMRRTGTNDLTIDRRSRLSMNNSTGVLPLGETTEAYLWEFYTTSGFTTLIGSVETTTSTVTAAQQTAIGVTPSATHYVRVYQLSDSVGRGHELQATI